MRDPKDSTYSTISNPKILQPLEDKGSIYSLKEATSRDLNESVLLKLDSNFNLETTNVTRYSELFTDELGR